MKILRQMTDSVVKPTSRKCYIIKYENKAHHPQKRNLDLFRIFGRGT